MTCQEVVEFLDDYLEGELSAEKRREFERHLALCTACERYLDGYKKTVALGRAAFADPQAEVPAAVPEDLVQAILAARRRG